MTTTHTRLLVAVASAALAVPTANAVALPGADGAYPTKNTTYSSKGEIASYDYRASVKIKVGKNITKVDKVTIKITCPDGKQKYVKKNLAINESGYIFWDQRWPVYFFGQFTSRRKVDRVSVMGDQTKVCSDYVINLDDARA